MAPSRAQRRGRSIAMSPGGLDAFLRDQRTCRVGTIGGDGSPHVSPLWFVWDGASVWLSSVVKSQRWTNLMWNPRISALIDTGHDYGELRGVELLGTVEVVGDVPRTGGADPHLETPERLFALKYFGQEEPVIDGRHAWLRLTPEKVVSWDFRKLGA